MEYAFHVAAISQIAWHATTINALRVNRLIIYQKGNAINALKPHIYLALH